MKLANGTIRPGVVVDVLGGGEIKATAPGLFNRMDDPAFLPPIMPWFIGNNANSYSQPRLFDEVWILNFDDNPLQLFWFRKDYPLDNWENIPMNGRNVEVVCNRDIGGEFASLYFSDGSGWVISKGGSMIRINANGDIVLTTGANNRAIAISNNGISLGSANGSAHPVACGDGVEDILTALCTLFNGIAKTALSNPHTAAIGTELMTKLPAISDMIPNVSSQHVTVD